jgi:hypothetical protein
VAQGTKRGRDDVLEPVTTLVMSENEMSKDDISEATTEDEERDSKRIREV